MTDWDEIRAAMSDAVLLMDVALTELQREHPETARHLRRPTTQLSLWLEPDGWLAKLEAQDDDDG